jgi:murein DD-endopeptidase MepM/ murein hydrolase activator NlpD
VFSSKKIPFLKILTFLGICFLLHKLDSVFAETSPWAQINGNINIFTIKTSVYGLLSGERDTRFNLNPYNGVRLSQDLGVTWENIGLAGTGVTDLAVQGETLYAVTFFVVNGEVGLYVKENKDSNWVHKGPNASGGHILADGDTVVLGTKSNGLWISQDRGNTFTQKIGTGWYGPQIYSVAKSGTTILVGAALKTYISRNNGETFSEIPALRDKIMLRLLIYDAQLFFAGTLQEDGLYKSEDAGTTWTKLTTLVPNKIEFLLQYKQTIYVAGIGNSPLTLSVYRSEDRGRSWTDTELSLPSTGSSLSQLTYYFADMRHYLFYSGVNHGIYRYTLPETSPSEIAFLDPIWNSQNPNRFIDNISSFFDHSYPLYGYSYFKEPTEEKTTTLNFLGQKATEPNLYYSSHDGIDFSLPVGTPLLAPADGLATYYTCTPCGNAIKINHQNGYQTTYLHLQKDGLFTKGTNVPIHKGETLGKVGMTGNTSGPHVHFSILKDINNNGSFSDDYVSGRVDPFGWNSTNDPDPWGSFEWTDTLGTHLGTNSFYMWNNAFPEQTAYVTNVTKDQQLTLDNTTISFDSLNGLIPLTILAKTYAKAIIPKTQKDLKYIPNTSLLLNSYDTLGKQIASLEGTLQIVVDITNVDLSKVIPDTLKLYFWDETAKLWESLPSVVDFTTKVVTAETTHLSQFALLAEKKDKNLPETIIELNGEMTGDWYNSSPTVGFLVVGDTSPQVNVYYSLDDGNNWVLYQQPFTLSKEGLINIFYRAEKDNTYEETKNQIIKIGGASNWKKKIVIKNARFTVSATSP